MARGLKAHQKGLEVDPLSVGLTFYMGVVLFWRQEFKDALPSFEKILEMVPNHRTAQEDKGWTAALQQEYEEALTIFNKLKPAIGYRLHRSTCLGWVYHQQGEKEKAKACLQELEQLEAQAIQGTIFTLDLATLYTGFGNFDLAFHYFEKAIRNKIGDTMMCRSDPFLAPLRSDSRFKKMEALIGDIPGIDILDQYIL